MEVHGEGGVLGSPSGCMGWVYGKILGGVVGFVVILDLRWDMAQRLDFRMIFGMGYGP
jgi:hypothetical protein